MEKFKLSLFFVILIFVMSCAKDNNPSEAQVIFNLMTQPRTAPADGTTIVYASVQLNPDATTDKRTVVFKISTGQFVSNKDTTLNQGAVFTNGKLIATAAIQMPLSGDSLTITAQPNLPDIPNNAYLLKKTVLLSKSSVNTINLVANSTGVNSNYQNEVVITGTLVSKSGSKVSTGAKVIFQDFLDSGAGANGIFRGTSDVSNASSQVATNYSAGAYPIGTRITIRCYVVGTSPIIAGTTTIFINK